MPTVRDAATIHSPLLTLDEKKLPDRARLLYERAKSFSGYDAPAHTLTGSLTNVLFDLWPEYVALKDTQQFTAFRIEIYTFLRVTGNARCVQRRNPSIWLLAPEWIADTSHDGRALRFTPAERRLTAQELGENLPPAPVTVTQLPLPAEPAPVVDSTPPAVDTPDPIPSTPPTPTPTVPEPRDARGARLTGNRLQRHLDHRQLLDMVVEWSTREIDGQPFVLEELANVLAVHTSTARSLAADLVADKRLFQRRETPDERRTRFNGQKPRAAHAVLYSHLNPPPERTEFTIVAGVAPKSDAWDVKTFAPRGETEAAVLGGITRDWQHTVQVREAVPTRSPAVIDQTLRRLQQRGDVEMRRFNPVGKPNGPERNHYRLARPALPAEPANPAEFVDDEQLSSLKSHFAAHPINQKDLAAELGIDTGQMSRKLSGARRFTHAEAASIARVLGVTYPELLTTAPTAPTQPQPTTTKDAPVTATAAAPPVPAQPKPAAPKPPAPQGPAAISPRATDLPSERALAIARILDDHLGQPVTDEQLAITADLEKRNQELQRQIKILTRERDEATQKLAAARALFA